MLSKWRHELVTSSIEDSSLSHYYSRWDPRFLLNFYKHTKHLYPWYKFMRNAQPIFQGPRLMREEVTSIHPLPSSLIVFSSLSASIPLSVGPPSPFPIPFLWISSQISLVQSHFKFQRCLLSCPILLSPQRIMLVFPTSHSPSMGMPRLPSVYMRGTVAGWSPSIDPKQMPSWLWRHWWLKGE